MMEILKTVSAVLVIVTAILGIIGGLLSLPLQFRRLRRALLPHGNRETSFVCISEKEGSDITECTFIVADDLIHFLHSWAKAENLCAIKSVEPVGDYYKAVITYPTGTRFKKTIKQKERK